MVFIYILLLNENKYYIGKTHDPYNRIKNHFDGKGSAFTRKYKPLNIEYIIKDCDVFDEDKYTLIYMHKYGVENVRGGSFVELDFPKETKKHIIRMINSVSNKCFRCSSDEHFLNQCPLYKDVISSDKIINTKRQEERTSYTLEKLMKLEKEDNIIKKKIVYC
jgi:hypothetical protein